ncbi:MAG: hypothetical protein QXP05_07010 [Ignisphaera sp.]
MDKVLVSRIMVFVLVSYTAAYALDYLAIRFSIPISLWVFIRMWSIALSSLLCLCVFEMNIVESLKHYLSFSKNVVKYYLLAPLIIYGALLLYIATALPLGLFNFDEYVASIANQIHSVAPSLVEEQVTMLALLNAYLSIIVAYPIAITVNMLVALGEEISWRGYLYTLLGSRPNLVNTIVIGTPWRLRHASVTILLGWNYYYNRYLGIILFTI